MKNTKNIVCCMCVLLLLLSACVQKQTELADFVNPFIGASTNTAHSYHGLGKTYPGATTPFGMVQVSPNTITGGDNASGYSDEHTSIEGFAFTQMSGVGWYGDLGNFLVMPTTGELKTVNGGFDDTSSGYRSMYDKSTEVASPAYYSVYLSDYKIKAEATATTRSGLLRFTFPEHKQSRIQIDLARRVGGTSTWQEVKIVGENAIEGYMLCPPEGGGWGNGMGNASYTVYFYAEFSRPITQSGVWSADIPEGQARKLEDVTGESYKEIVAQSTVVRQVEEYAGKHIGFFAEFDTQADEQILLKAGISFVSTQNAKENLQKEIKGWDFDRVHAQSRNEWNEALAKMTVTGGSADDKTIFYTALYHTLLDPRIYADVNGEYIGGDNQVHKQTSFTKRTIFSGWDVFRSQMPLQTIINPTVVSDIINSLTTLAEENGTGYYERWEFLNAYSGCMIGNPAISVLADAYAKGIREYDVEKAYQIADRTSELFGNGSLGYIPKEKGYSISETLEYAYSDWCMMQLAQALGKPEDAERYAIAAKNYRHIFDQEKNWFRVKKESGEWDEWPENGRLTEWYGSIEANPYQQGWFVPHDIEGMCELMGGTEKVKADLIDFFEKTPADYLWNEYYNHANEPVHHVPFLFNRIGAPWLTQQWTRNICANAYQNRVDGLVGNEDVGQMSAWYVLAATGLHPVCPGSTRYEITSPVFDSIVISLDRQYAQGKSFTIVAYNNSSENVYIERAVLNGKPYDNCHIDHADIMKGGVLELYMSHVANEQWGYSTPE